MLSMASASCTRLSSVVTYHELLNLVKAEYFSHLSSLRPSLVKSECSEIHINNGRRRRERDIFETTKYSRRDSGRRRGILNNLHGKSQPTTGEGNNLGPRTARAGEKRRAPIDESSNTVKHTWHTAIERHERGLPRVISIYPEHGDGRVCGVCRPSPPAGLL